MARALFFVLAIGLPCAAVGLRSNTQHTQTESSVEVEAALRARLQDRQNGLSTAVETASGKLADMSLAMKKGKEAEERKAWLEKVKQDGRKLRDAPERFQRDSEIVLAAVEKDDEAFYYADASLKRDREFVLAAVQIDGYFFQFVDASLKRDREIVLTAVKSRCNAIGSADPALLKDREVVMAAVGQGGCSWTIKYVVDRDLVLALVKELDWTLFDVHLSLKRDREIVLAAVRKNGLQLEHADPAMKMDQEVVLAAMGQNGVAFRYSSPSLRSDPEILRVARENGWARCDWMENYLPRGSWCQNRGHVFMYGD